MVFLFQLTVGLNPFTIPRETPRDEGGAVQGNRAPESASNLDQRGDRPEKTAKKDDDFWFEDGNIIIVVQHTKFRVYRGPLIKHSLVFRDMLSLPQPVENSEKPQDLPIIYLEDDPSDIRRILSGFIFGNTLQCAP